MDKKQKPKTRLSVWLSLPFVLILTLVVMLIFLPLYLLTRFIQRIVLLTIVRFKWISKGKDVLIVYSDSPHWKDLFESKIIPSLENRAVIINWSKRNAIMKNSLEFYLYKHFSRVFSYKDQKNKVKWSGSDYLPFVIIFKPWWRPVVQRYWKAFLENKKGRTENLNRMLNDVTSLE